MAKYRVSVVVEVNVRDGSTTAVEAAEATVQRVLDRYAKRLDAVAGADYGTVSEVEGS
jgi:outer membrane biosynthesis protein TonB